jgi:outer membrane protein assembly factor BamB
VGEDREAIVMVGTWPSRWMTGTLAALVLVPTAAALAVRPQESLPIDGWRQWGGPSRNFVVDSVRLADDWQENSPATVWRRPLGDGHSSILLDDGHLYTMYRPAPSGSGWADEEVVIALDEGTGETLWEHRYPARPLAFRFGAGPFATPLIVGDRLFSLGTNNQLFALDTGTGTVLWSHDLVDEFGAEETLIRPAVKAGMSCSPIAWGDTVIVTAGGAGQSVMAFSQASGDVVWRSGDFNLSQASPILIEVDGQPQLVVFGGMDVNGLDPTTGRLLWSHPHDTSGDMNISTPLWSDDGLLFISSAYDGGSRMLRLQHEGEAMRAEELWFSNQLRLHIGNALRIGAMVIGSNGDFGPSFITALDAETGERLWQDRSFARAQILHADGKLVILDEDGVLGLARASAAGLEVLGRTTILANLAWTAPTLVGASLYARDRREIVKVELPTRNGPN